MDLTPTERAELAAFRAKQAKLREIGQARGKANAKLLPCPQCAAPANARQRRKPCQCGYRWPVKDR